MGKKVHLSVEEIRSKIEKLEQEKRDPSTQANKTKRKRVYAQLAKLQKALQDPQELVVDPVEEQEKIQNQKNRRIEKKMAKKQDQLRELKNKKRHQKKCLKCGSRQHLLGECPQNKGTFCFKCGAHDHSHKQCTKTQYSLADCFYCGKKGHIARQCPDNEKGLYVKGGSCFGCGSVRHILRDCPNNPRNKTHAGTFKNTEQF